MLKVNVSHIMQTRESTPRSAGPQGSGAGRPMEADPQWTLGLPFSLDYF